MRQIIYFFVIISLSSAINAQIQNRSLDYKIEKQTFPAAVSLEKETEAISEEVALINRKGVDAALKNNDYRTAKNLFQQATEIDSGCLACRYNLGKSLYELGEIDAAIDVMNNLIKQNPGYSKSYAVLGDAFKNKKRFVESIAAYEKALAIEPKDAITLCNLGIVQYHAEKYDLALQSFEKSIKLVPDLIQALSNRGVTFVALGRYKDALSDFRKAETINPKSAEVQNNIGMTLMCMGKQKEAHKYFVKALEINPEFSFAIYNLAINFLDRDDRASADTQLRYLEKVDYEMAEQLRKQFWKKYVVDAGEMKKALN